MKTTNITETKVLRISVRNIPVQHPSRMGKQEEKGNKRK